MTRYGEGGDGGVVDHHPLAGKVIIELRLIQTFWGNQKTVVLNRRDRNLATLWTLITFHSVSRFPSLCAQKSFLTFGHSARRFRPQVVEEVEVEVPRGRKCQRDVAVGHGDQLRRHHRHREGDEGLVAIRHGGGSAGDGDGGVNDRGGSPTLVHHRRS